jgi:hypothetical protein
LAGIVIVEILRVDDEILAFENGAYSEKVENRSKI